MLGILSVYVAVSHDYPQMGEPFRATIGLDWCGMRHCPDCDDFLARNFFWKITPILPAWL